MLFQDSYDDMDGDDPFDESNYTKEELEDNKYLCDPEKAIGLIGKIIPLENSHKLVTVNRKKKLDSFMDERLLGSLKYIHLTREAELQFELSSIRKKLYEEKKYHAIKNKAVVGFGGKFSAGKSKFINSILNVCDLLPENQNPTTSVATYIVQGTENQICVYTTGNVEQNVDHDAFHALTHSFYEKYKIGFSSFIDCIIVNDKNMKYGDIVFLDTPGYSKADVFEGSDEEVSRSDAMKACQQLSNVDFLIWLIDIENGEISIQDLDFIKRLDMHSPILFVLNKADKKPDNEIKRIIDKVRTTVEASCKEVYGVTAYSSVTGEEWNNNMISRFLQMVSRQKKSSQDLRLRLKDIEGEVGREIEKNLQDIQNENAALYRVISGSNNVTEIKSLVDIYGEKRKEYRRLLECKDWHERNAEELERTLESYYGDNR